MKSSIKNLEGKFILLDTDFLVSLLRYKQTQIMDNLRKLQASFVTIEPVNLELMNTNSQKERLARSRLLKEYKIEFVPLDKSIVENAKVLQEKQAEINCYPSVVDLYLGATLMKFANGKTLLATSNLKDFSEILFRRDHHIILETERSSKLAWLLSYVG